jgi:hypothetical protein
VLVFFGYANIVISPAYVKLGKQGFPMELFQCHLNIWQWIIVVDCIGIDLPIIHYYPLLAFLFLVNEEGG